MAAPSGAVGGDLIEHLDGRETHRIAAPSRLKDQVGQAQGDGEHKEGQSAGNQESEIAHLVDLPAAMSRALRPETKRTKSSTQSRSVVSVR